MSKIVISPFTVPSHIRQMSVSFLVCRKIFKSNVRNRTELVIVHLNDFMLTSFIYLFVCCIRFKLKLFQCVWFVIDFNENFSIDSIHSKIQYPMDGNFLVLHILNRIVGCVHSKTKKKLFMMIKGKWILWQNHAAYLISQNIEKIIMYLCICIKHAFHNNTYEYLISS